MLLYYGCNVRVMAHHVGEMGYNYNPSLRHHVYVCVLRSVHLCVRQADSGRCDTMFWKFNTLHHPHSHLYITQFAW